MALVIELPSRCGVTDVPRLIRRLALADSRPGEELVLDLRGVRFLAALPSVILLAQARILGQEGRRRLDVLSTDRTSHDSPLFSGPSRESDGWTPAIMDRLGLGARAAIAPVLPTTRSPIVAAQIVRDALHGTPRGIDVEQLLEYVVGELMKNIQQHSRGHGFITARYLPKDGLFSIAAADDGIGIRASYLTSLSPRVRGKEALDDAGWLDEALVLESSSKTHLRGPFGEPPVNRGVGLTISRAFAKECLGDFVLVSGSGFLEHRFGNAHAPIETPAFAMEASYGGTACHLSFNLSALGNVAFQDFRRSVLRDLGLLGPGGDLTVAEDCFIG